MCQSLWSIALLLVFSVFSGLCGVVFQDSLLYEGSSCKLLDGRAGVCSVDCTAEINPDQRKICGFKSSQVLMCCPSKKSYPILEEVCSDRTKSGGHNTSPSSFKNRRKIEENGPEVQRIHPAALNEHPHMAALGRRQGEGGIEWYCGGTVIHETFVLTAAHCLSNIGAPDVVRIGITDLTPNPIVPIHAVPISQFSVLTSHIHEDYQPPLYYNDIALLQIEKQTREEGTKPYPACIWTAEELPTNNLLMMGYGAPAFSQEHTNKLYQGNLTVVGREECNQTYAGFTDLPKGIIGSQICAHDPKGILDTCEGDSGGPLQFNADDLAKTPYLVGITSFGVLCLDGNPGVYTKVANYLDWIEGTIRKLQSV